MNKHAGTFQTEIVDSVRALVADSLSGVDLIQALNGIHPIEIKKTLVKAGERRLLEAAYGNLNISGSVLKEIQRDDNPVLSFWPFTTECALEISNNISDGDVALLGVPTVFSVLRERSIGRAVLFDNDDYLFGEKVTDGYVRCDVLSEVPSRYESQFDLVLGDPPWYLEEYCAWLKAAVGLVRPGGTVVFVLFPPKIRDNSDAERNGVLAVARDLLLDVEIMPISAFYETPSFEQVELIRNGISPVNWRRAQFFAGRVPNDKGRLTISTRANAPENWIERRIGCGRIFVKDEPAYIPDFLEPAGRDSRFLSSPSRRDLGRSKANVISSRGHGLRCNDPRLLLEIFEKIRHAEDIEGIDCSLDSSSASLLKAVANDLWPRFIEVKVSDESAV